MISRINSPYQLGRMNQIAKRKGGDVTPWYLVGGIDPADCVAAYQAKGAVSYAASKVNLANAGTYDVVDGAVYPAWDVKNGWKFISDVAGETLNYLSFPSASEITIAIFYKRLTNNDGWYSVRSDTFSINLQQRSGGQEQIHYGDSRQTNNSDTNDTVWLWNKEGVYKNGAFVQGWSPSSSTGKPSNIRTQRGNGAPKFHVYAIAFYSTTLTASQIAALTSAMQAL